MIDLTQARQRFHEEFAKAVAAQINEFDAEQMTRDILADLNAQKRQVIGAMLGIEKAFGEWRVDRTNGRTSLVGELVTKSVNESTLHAWLAEALREILASSSERLKKQYLSAIKKDFEAQLQQQLQSMAWKTAHDAAVAIAQQVKAELMSEYAPAD
jgi:hypothetical protein